MELRHTILKCFIDNFPDLANKMEKTSHHGKNYQSQHHLEGSVMTHTLLVYNQANYIPEYVMALCHDIGKCFTRKVKDETGKIVFYGHPEVSVQYAVDFIDVLEREGIITLDEAVLFIKYIISPIGNHMLFYQNAEKINYLSNGSKIIYDLFKKMALMDTKGSISKTSEIDNKVLEHELSGHFNREEPVIYLWSGVPGSGKDYLAEQNGLPIFSFDNIRVALYKDANEGWDDMTEAEIYNNAFHYCNDNKINLMDILKTQVKKELKKGNDVNICNTSLTRKSRRKLVNAIGTKYNYIVKHVFAPSEIIFKRNALRDSKYIEKGIIRKMMNSVNVPTLFEKHISTVEYIYNV